MSTQIVVWLPDRLITFIDELVVHGEATDRDQVISQALDRERRRHGGDRDAASQEDTNGRDEFDALVEYTSRTPLDDLD